ncbi:hypothetical protein [Actinophytocola xanthii]|uniref:DUF402 domain-containing protein n=1 Tax=Actinophytocola xanthii TaxID=1912961 RepID=A0A1Q8CPM7_9PSEU|nr:hypothetical protein [Actinophytocola xanthii]OLF16314.1 hypothetical protein BU204_17155 [Actinophytocola xanthii]
MIYMAGQTIVLRERGADGTSDRACTVVCDEERGLLLRVLGAPGRADTDRLVLLPPGATHAVWWRFTRRAFTGWHVALYESATPWGARGVAGITVVDRGTGGIDVTPDLRWFRTGAATGGDPDTEPLLSAIESGHFPFDGTWCDRSALASWRRPRPAAITALLYRHRTRPPAA